QIHRHTAGNPLTLKTDSIHLTLQILIQSITLVMPVADEMRQQDMIHPEMYNRIHAARTSQDKMRELYKALTTTKVKSAFYRILQEIQPPTCESM
uniref:CARD domain-containing protein n=1 Tax=Amphilophus citrinellus TaxID=61819 RepID=A0A3Q0SW16_AMPCI